MDWSAILIFLLIAIFIMEFPYIALGIFIFLLLLALYAFKSEKDEKERRKNEHKERLQKETEQIEKNKKILGEYFDTWFKHYKTTIDSSAFKKIVQKIKRYNFDKKLTLLEDEKAKYEKKIISAIKKEARSFNSEISKLEELIAKEYFVSMCSSCNERDLILINFNSNASSAQLKCTTCNKKSWAKIKNEGKAEEYQEVFDDLTDDLQTRYFHHLNEALEMYFDNISWEGIKIWKKADDLVQYKYLLKNNFNATDYRIWEIIHEIDGENIYRRQHGLHKIDYFDEEEYNPYDLDDYQSSDNSSYYFNEKTIHGSKRDDAFVRWSMDFEGQDFYEDDPSLSAMINLFDKYFPDYRRLQFIEYYNDIDNYKFSYEKLNLVVSAENIAESSESRRQPIPQDVKTRVWQRDEGKCVNCGSNENLEYDHIIPVVKGGANTFRNIQLLCETCNRSKGAKI